ncbi:response regulator transcription factor [Nitrincola sp. MINF-07-Sa-05]|uniref:response regulator transcription factor n=1 Tax=Nitrincola salilacus TaxID=3400273 RepID=UPI003917D5BF
MNLFITDKGFVISRWTEAFPDARVQLAAEADHLISSLDRVWILTDTPNWKERITFFSEKGIKVIALTRAEETTELRSALNAGARAYLNALSNPAILQQAAQTVDSGGLWLPSEMINKVIRVISGLLSDQEKPSCDLSALTDREKEVATAVVKGGSNKEIANELDITERTVKAHLSSVFEKLGVRDRMHLLLIMKGRG